MTWPPLELDVGVDEGELRPELPDDELPDDELPDDELPDDELPDDVEPDLPLLDELELLEPELVELEPERPVSDLAWCVAEPEVCDAAPGRLTATTPAAARLAAVADIVATRSRLRPRSRSAIAGDAPRGGMLCLLMRMSLAARFPMPL